MDKFVTKMGREQNFLNWMVEKSTIEMGSMKRIAAAAKTTGATVDSIIWSLAYCLKRRWPISSHYF